MFFPFNLHSSAFCEASLNETEINLKVAIILKFCIHALLIILGIVFDLLKPTGYVMHHQFNIQQLYALPTLYLCVLYLSENKQRLVPLTA